MTIWLGWICFAAAILFALVSVYLSYRWSRLVDRVAAQREAWRQMYEELRAARWN